MSELNLYLPGILLAYAACLLGLASPGPNVLAVLGTSMGEGRRAGIALALGIAGGSVLWALMTAAGLSALLMSYAAALTVIKVAGGLYLLWLAFKAFRAAASAHPIATTVDRQPSPQAYVLRGLAIQMTNPKAVLAWIAIMSLGLQHDAPPWVVVAIVVGTSTLSLAIHYLYAVAFSTPMMVRVYGRARRPIQATLGVFFGCAGIKLLASR
jgi:threonine/homoserine/homoserine lactone efflux protein